MEKKAYYAIIPANIRYDDRLKPNAKLLYGEITALCNEKGYCWAGNQYFADLYNVSKKTVSKWITDLNRCGYITVGIEYEENSKVIKYRYITLGSIPIREKAATYTPKSGEGIRQKAADNNTLINNTSNNTNIKKKKSDIDILIDDYTDNEDLRETLEEFLKMRKSIKKPMTNKAMELLLKKLNKMTCKNDEKVAILNQSIFNSWQGIFPLKEGIQDGRKEQPNNSSNTEDKIEYDFTKYGA